MKRLIAIAFALTFVTAAWGQLYKWVDKDGKVHYSDTPPNSQDSKQINVPTGGPASAPVPAAQKDKEAEKGRLDGKEAAKKAEDDAKRAAYNAERCTRARGYLKTLVDGGRIVTYDAKGERQILDDAQIESERVRAQKAADESCKTT
jgi:Domain of unknown function (DUF4124)